MENKELQEKLKSLANDYEEMTYSDIQGVLMAYETIYNEDYDDLFNKLAEMVIAKRIKSMQNEFYCKIEYKIIERNVY